MKGEKYMKSIKHYDDFTDVLNRMNNDDFALFLTGYAESIGRNIQLLPIHIDKFDCLAWVGYFTENGGLNGDDENRFIVSEILKNAYCSDYVLIEEGEERPKLTFFTKKNLKSEMFKHLFVVKLFTDKKAWSEPLYENGRSNDTYTAFCEYLTTEEISELLNENNCYDIIVGIMYVRRDENVEVDKIAFVGTDVDFNYIKKVDENLNVLEELGQADTFLYTKTNFNNKIFVKNERDFDLIKSLPYYQNNVELVKEFPNE